MIDTGIKFAYLYKLATHNQRSLAAPYRGCTGTDRLQLHGGTIVAIVKTDDRMSPMYPTRFLGCAVLIAITLGFAAACGSIDERSDEGEDDDNTSPYQLQTLTDSCGDSPSFTGRSLLDRLDVPYRAPVALEEGDQPTSVELDIAYAGGRRTCYPWDRGEPPRTPRLELAVELHLTTDDDAVDVTVPGTVSVLADSDQVRFSGSLPYTSLDGRLAAAPDADPRMTEVFVEGWIGADSDASQGAVRLVTPGEREALDHRTIASWNS